MTFAFITLLAFLIDIALGWPAVLYGHIKHPVVWIGAQISWFENRLNRGSTHQRRFNGMMCTLMVVGSFALPAAILQWALLPSGILGMVLLGVLIWPFIATRSMYDHVLAVWKPLASGDLAAARRAVAMIVGRDPATLDPAGVARAALESLAENTSDGIVAPVFWAALLGLPGIVAYKAINTLDSMIGHHTEKYEDFGKFAARLDDLVNWIPARLTGALFALAAGPTMGKSFRIILRDAKSHRSPNAGWPESAMAGALNCRLSGPRAYGKDITNEPWLNGSAPDPNFKTVERGLQVFQRAMALLGLVLILLLLL